MARNVTPQTRADDHLADERPPAQARRRHLAFGLVAALLVIATGVALYAMTTVVIPIVLAVFITLATLPLDRALAARLPGSLAWLGRVAVMTLLLLIITLFLAGLTYCVGRIATQLPDLSQNFEALWPAPDGDGRLAELRRDFSDLMDGQTESMTGRLIDSATALAQGILGATGILLTGMVLVLFLVLLALGEARTWEAKFDSISTGAHGTWRDVTVTLGGALRRFIVTRAAMGVISAVAYVLWLLPFGVDLLLVWAVLTFLMNFIPNLGSIVSGFFPTIYAFLTKDFGTALIIGAGLIVIEQVLGNWVDPKLQGSQVALSPLIILIAVVFWGWLWGIAGAFLGTPMTLAIMIVCNSIMPLRPIALLLSNQKQPEDLDAALA